MKSPDYRREHDRLKYLGKFVGCSLGENIGYEPIGPYGNDLTARTVDAAEVEDVVLRGDDVHLLVVDHTERSAGWKERPGDTREGEVAVLPG